MSRAAFGIATLLLAACAGSAEERVVVSAASSLGEAFTELEVAFEESNPGTDVVLNLAGTSLLREQILGGAPVDVFASASPEVMGEIEEAGAVAGEPIIFASNPIQIAVPAGNPANIRGLEDFSRRSLYLGLCAAQVPCGALARDTFEKAGVVPLPDTNEPNVRALLTKIELGELDAGVVYLTDVLSGNVEGIEIPEPHLTRALYPIAQLAEAPNPGHASEFLSFVLSAEGAQILGRHGFMVP